MKLCSACKGTGFDVGDSSHLCHSCDGEGIISQTTFTVGKIGRRKELDYTEHQKSKKQKFDKKNAVRGE